MKVENNAIVSIKIFLFITCIVVTIESQAQDMIDSGDISSIQEFRTDLNDRIQFGETYKQLPSEDLEKFVIRILNDKSNLHHGAFELDDFHKCIVSFATYKFQEISIIVGLLLEPTSLKGEYRLLKTMELSSGCGEEPKVMSVFLHHADPNSLGKELIIHASDYCGRHGKYNYVFIYNGIVSNHKLELQNYLTERCDYSEVKINGEWDFDMGDENVEDRRYNECEYSDYKVIRQYFDNAKKE